MEDAEGWTEGGAPPARYVLEDKGTAGDGGTREGGGRMDAGSSGACDGDLVASRCGALLGATETSRPGA